MTTQANPLVSYSIAFELFVGLERQAKSSNAQSYQCRIVKVIEYTKQCMEQRQRDAILSRNELYYEMSNEQLYATCLEYYLAFSIPQQSISDPDIRSAEALKIRMQKLIEADVYYSEFLNTMEQINLFPEKERKKQYVIMEDPQVCIPRDIKIQRFQKVKELEALYQQSVSQIADGALLSSDSHEDEARECILHFLQLVIIKSLNEQVALHQERIMLDKVSTMDPIDTTPPSPQNGLTVTHISNTMEMKRQVIRSQVFQASHRLPTKSLAQYADEEMANAEARQETETSSTAPRRYDQLLEDGDEDEEGLMDLATKEDRSWDDWKDANPRGIGNKKGSQF